MSVAAAEYTEEVFADAADRLGFSYVNVGETASITNEEEPKFEGFIGTRTLPCGISVWSSDLTCVRSGTMRAVCERSFKINILLGDHNAEIKYGAGEWIGIPKNGGAVLMLAEATESSSRYNAGDHAQVLLLSTMDHVFLDTAVAEQLERALSQTRMVALPVGHRTRQLAEELAHPSSSGAVGRLLAESAALELLAQGLSAIEGPLSEEIVKTLSKREHAQLKRVSDFMMASLQSDFSLNQLAQEAGMSVSGLKAKFPLAYGMPVFAFLRELRMEAARRGLQYEGWTITQAATFAGYKHQSNFSSAFRNKFGHTPGAITMNVDGFNLPPSPMRSNSRGG